MPRYNDYPAAVFQPLLLTKQEWKKPLLVIDNFFTGDGLASQMALFYQWKDCAFSKKTIPKQDLCIVQVLYDEVLRLLEAATLAKAHPLAILRENDNLMDEHLWLYTLMGNYEPFDYFPRHLTEADYRNPYRIFEQVSREQTLPRWRASLAELWNAGIVTDDIYEGREGAELARAYDSIPQLLEAAHLIYVRQIKKTTRDTHARVMAEQAQRRTELLERWTTNDQT